MPASIRIPSYRLHRCSGRAVVTLGGRDVFLGKHGTPESRGRYQRIIAEWLANDRRLSVSADDITIIELVDRFWTHAQSYYRLPDGTPSKEAAAFKDPLRMLRELYGDTLAKDFGPLGLRALQGEMIRRGWCRNYINRQTARLRAVFKWGVGRQLIPPSVHHAVCAVEGLRQGRSEARESESVKPVPDAHVEAILSHVSPQVVAMIRLQQLTGARPGEIVTMRTCDIDTTGTLWLYKPAAHKTAHFGYERVIYIGPKAQAILRPLLKHDLQAFIFSPAEAEADRRERMHAQRTIPLSCGNVPGSNRVRRPRRQPGNCYTVASYRRAIARACDAADARAKGGVVIGNDERIIPRFHPHQIRHAAGTALRKEFGIEAAQVVLGHKTLRVTEIYAEANVRKAAEVMAKIG